MQPLTDDPRGAYTATQMRALLVAPDLDVDYGVELLDDHLALVEDISSDVSSCTVKRDNFANVHGTVALTISRELAWGRDRIRPFMLLSSRTVGVQDVRWNLGVYIVTTPELLLNETSTTPRTVTGFDQMHLLQNSLGDTYRVPKNVGILGLVRAALTNAGITAPVLLDSTFEGKTIPIVLVWPVTSDSAPTWLQVVNKLLFIVGYRGIWVDQDGAFRSGPMRLPRQRPSEWTFTVGDPKTGIVAAERTIVQDLWNIPNWWRFVRTNMTTAPIEGAGRYTVQNLTTGPTSQAAVGRVIRAPVQYLDDVPTQADLVFAADGIVDVDTTVAEVIHTTLSPFPAAWHWDRATYSDPDLGPDRQVQCQSWELPTDGSDMTYILATINE